MNVHGGSIGCLVQWLHAFTGTVVIGMDGQSMTTIYMQVLLSHLVIEEAILLRPLDSSMSTGSKFFNIACRSSSLHLNYFYCMKYLIFWVLIIVHIFIVTGYDMSTFIRRYAKYLNEKATTYRLMAFDFCKVKRGRDDGLLRTMNSEKVS